MTPKHVVVVTGELSGDQMAAPVVRELSRRLPGLEFFGAGGPGLAAEGVELRHHIRDLSVTGFSEAAGRLPAALCMLADLALEIRRRRPVLAILVDYPGINLRLAALLRRLGVPVLYYGAPQRWAWLAWRTAALRRDISRLAVTLPFEERWFQDRGVPATFVGHPVRDSYRPPPRAVARRRLELDEGVTALALLPGSRPNEIRRHLPLLLKTLRRLPGVTGLLAVSPGAHELCDAIVERCPSTAPLCFTDTQHALAAGDAALCSSGSATLELAVAGVPGVVFYRVSPLTHAVARRLVKVSMIALPNLIHGHEVLPELIQREMSPERLAREARRLLAPAVAAEVRAALLHVTRQLGEPGVARRVADLAMGLIPR
jgi:lipid-A-disaccharide synthase